jgi:cation diffusion facilitator family transporter
MGRPAAPLDDAALVEKRSVALISVGAAVLLTGTKLVVGLWTNSLGILSEAAHSGLDLLAAGMTLWAVSVSGRPADGDHTYGHGKVENLSALAETLLLLGTCGWIIMESCRRLLFHEAVVSVNAWSFSVVILSITVDYWRARALQRAADKFGSQALEADALHFSTDIWSSAVVLAGLAGVLAAEHLGLPWLRQADAVAALGVAIIVLVVCYRLGRKSVDDLLDAAPRGLREKVEEAAKVPGVREVRQVRVRRSGPSFFADVTVTVGHDAPFERAHAIADQAEASVREVLPGADVVVHVEPCAEGADPISIARALAARHGFSANSLRLCDDPEGSCLDLHLEVRPGLSVEQAHREVSAYEADLRASLPTLSEVVSHIEPAGQNSGLGSQDAAGEDLIRTAVSGFELSEKVAIDPHDIRARMHDGELSLSLHCSVDPKTPVEDAHDLTVRLEKHLRAAVPNLKRVVIHVEPPNDPR